MNTNMKTNTAIAVAVAVVVVGFLMRGLIFNQATPAVPSTDAASQAINDQLTQSTTTSMNTIAPTDKLVVTDTTVGTGTAAKSGDHVYVNYVGTLTNGTKFDSSYDRGTPIDFILGSGQVIPGWDQGLVGMKVGGKRQLVIPPQLAYGPNAYGPIPGNSTLVFQVELVKIAQ